jgi:hypothetical protein
MGYLSQMPRYLFKIRQGERTKPSIATDCPDNDAAHREAAGLFVDVARDIAGDLQSNPKWQIEVADDEAGKTIFRLSVLAEYLK